MPIRPDGSLFGLRVGAAGGRSNSTTYARGFVVNQGGQACFEEKWPGKFGRLG
jgi:hypothetical protein